MQPYFLMPHIDSATYSVINDRFWTDWLH